VFVWKCSVCSRKKKAIVVLSAIHYLLRLRGSGGNLALASGQVLPRRGLRSVATAPQCGRPPECARQDAPQRNYHLLHVPLINTESPTAFLPLDHASHDQVGGKIILLKLAKYITCLYITVLKNKIHLLCYSFTYIQSQMKAYEI
jgi:hypothetical protein